jgi:hypothetical protein
MYATSKHTDVGWLRKLREWSREQDEFHVVVDKVYDKSILRLSRDASQL